MSVRGYQAAEMELVAMLLNDLYDLEYNPAHKDYIEAAKRIDEESRCMFIGKSNWRGWVSGILNARNVIRDALANQQILNETLVQIWFDLAEYLGDKDLPQVLRREYPLNVRSANCRVNLLEFYYSHVPSALRPNLKADPA
jgi:hypothetical protein